MNSFIGNRYLESEIKQIINHYIDTEFYTFIQEINTESNYMTMEVVEEFDEIPDFNIMENPDFEFIESIENKFDYVHKYESDLFKYIVNLWYCTYENKLKFNIYIKTK